jgi:hypothetical protein
VIVTKIIIGFKQKEMWMGGQSKTTNWSKVGNFIETENCVVRGE